MLEFNMNSIIWFFAGAFSTLAVFVIMGLCIVSGHHSRVEEKIKNQNMRFENWKATPDRLTMTKRGK